MSRKETLEHKVDRLRRKMFRKIFVPIMMIIWFGSVLVDVSLSGYVEPVDFYLSMVWVMFYVLLVYDGSFYHAWRACVRYRKFSRRLKEAKSVREVPMDDAPTAR